MADLEIVKECRTARDLYDTVRQHLSELPEDPVAVFDIDETLLLNEAGDDDDEAKADTEAKDGVTVHRVGQRLYRMCRAAGVPVVALTARAHTKPGRKYAREQLALLGYEVEKLYLLPREFADDPSPARGKEEGRRRIRGDDRSIVLCVGDQSTDHLGPNDRIAGGRSMRPDLFYLLRRDPTLYVKLPES